MHKCQCVFISILYMMLNFLPEKIKTAISYCDLYKLSEIRFRVGFFVKAKYDNKYVYLTKEGASLFCKDAIRCTSQDVFDIINSITENSLYAFNDRIKEGFITTKNGCRVGVCGECVFENGKISTIKNFTSLNVRIAHEIENCSNKIFEKIYNDRQLLNTLIISTPGFGKTTILKDLAKKLNQFNYQNVLIIDERGEFNSVSGENIDKISYSNKLYAFEYALRSMAPNVVVTDELSQESDWKCVETIINSGVKILASCHGESVKNIRNKKYFINNLFDRYVVLDNCNRAGQLKSVYDKDFNIL